MKILYHHRTLGDGAEGIHVQEMVEAFRNLGHDVRIIGPAATGNSGSRFKILKRVVKGPFYELMEMAYNLFGFFSITRQIERFQPDFIYDRYMLFNYSSVAAGKKYNKPVFIEINAPIALERFHEPDEALYFKSIAFKLERKICNDCFRTVAVSTPLKKHLITMQVPENKIIVRPNGVNLKTFTPVGKNYILLKNLGIAQDVKILGFTGVLRPWHGIDMLLKAFSWIKKKISNSVLLLVGDGPIQRGIEKKCKEFGIEESVKITGRVPHGKIKEYINLFDVAVSPRTTFYASPMKIPEYMAMGKCVVAPDTENIKDLVTNNVNGLLFEKNNTESLAKVLITALIDQELNEKISTNALKHAQENLSWINNAMAIIREYENNQH